MTDVLDLPENNIPSWIQGDVEDKGLQSPSPGQSPLAGQPPTQLSMSTCGDADDAATINSDEPEVPEDWGDVVGVLGRLRVPQASSTLAEKRRSALGAAIVRCSMDAFRRGFGKNRRDGDLLRSNGVQPFLGRT